jgi:hypothetical protein
MLGRLVHFALAQRVHQPVKVLDVAVEVAGNQSRVALFAARF